MGCDIHSWAEVREGRHWNTVDAVFPLDDFGKSWEKRSHTEHPFDWRSYGMFGFLADVRNYSHVPCIQKPVWSLPDDVSERVSADYGDDGDYHSLNVITLRTLLEFDYDQTFWDRRVTKQVAPNCFDGAALADEGEGRTLTIRGFLGKQFFEELEILKSLGGPDDVRIVFWFDN
jgi:hypothetical protein